MKPQLGDTISNRYVLVSPLREETGLQVWKASDHVLARDCQLFIVSSSKALQEVNATASMLAISHDSHFTKVLQLQHAGQVALVVTQLDEGMTLSEYLALNTNQPLSYTAMRSIIGEVIESLHALQKGQSHAFLHQHRHGATDPFRHSDRRRSGEHHACRHFPRAGFGKSGTACDSADCGIAVCDVDPPSVHIVD